MSRYIELRLRGLIENSKRNFDRLIQFRFQNFYVKKNVLIKFNKYIYFDDTSIIIY